MTLLPWSLNPWSLLKTRFKFPSNLSESATQNIPNTIQGPSVFFPKSPLLLSFFYNFGWHQSCLLLHDLGELSSLPHTWSFAKSNILYLHIFFWIRYLPLTLPYISSFSLLTTVTAIVSSIFPIPCLLFCQINFPKPHFISPHSHALTSPLTLNYLSDWV